MRRILALAIVSAAIAAACVIGPKQDDPAELKGDSGVVSDTSPGSAVDTGTADDFDVGAVVDAVKMDDGSLADAADAPDASDASDAVIDGDASDAVVIDGDAADATEGG